MIWIYTEALCSHECTLVLQGYLYIVDIKAEVDCINWFT